MKHPYLECGKIINIHGFRGTVKLESYCDSPEVLAHLPRVWFREGERYLAKRVLHASVFKQFVLADLEGVCDEAGAEKLRNVTVYAAREDLPLPDGGNFLADLIGLPVKDADSGDVLGTVKDIDRRGGRDFYVIGTPSGEYLVPDVPAFIIRADAEDALYLRPIPGLLDGGAEEL